jgi:hypothetical protein
MKTPNNQWHRTRHKQLFSNIRERMAEAGVFLQRKGSFMAHRHRPPFSSLTSLTGHCGHGWTCSLPRPVAIDPQLPIGGRFCCNAQRSRLMNVIGLWSSVCGRASEATGVHHVVRRRGGGVAARGGRAAGRARAADRRTDGLCGERSDRAVLGCSVPGCAREAGVVGRQQSPNRASVGRR